MKSSSSWRFTDRPSNPLVLDRLDCDGRRGFAFNVATVAHPEGHVGCESRKCFRIFTANIPLIRIDVIENERASKREQPHGLATLCPRVLRASHNRIRSASLQHHAAAGLANGATSDGPARSTGSARASAARRVPATFGRTPIRGCGSRAESLAGIAGFCAIDQRDRVATAGPGCLSRGSAQPFWDRELDA